MFLFQILGGSDAPSSSNLLGSCDPTVSRAARIHGWRAVLGIALVAPLAWATHAHAQVAVTSSSEVALEQVEYEDDGSSPDMSSAGQVIVNEAALASQSGISNGYLNIANSSGGWLVQNLPVISGVPYLATNLNLGTTDGTNETGQNVNLAIDVSSTPLTTLPTMTATPFTVGGEVEDSDQGEGATAGPLAAPGVLNLPFNAAGTTKAVVMLGIPNVQTADNQCGPSALANDLNWLATNKGLAIPDANNPGRGNTGNGTVLVPAGTVTAGVPNENVGVLGTNKPAVAGSSLVGALDLAMNRPSTNRISGNTTTGQQQTVGLETYLGGANVGDAASVKIDTQGNITAVTTNGITNTSYGAAVTPAFLYSELSASDPVKLGYTGHAVDIIATGSVEGIPWVAEQSDLAQTSQGDLLDQKLNSFLPFGLASSYSIPLFSYMDTSGANPVLVGIGSSVTVFNAIAVGVPEPSPMTLGLALVAFLALGRRRTALRAS